MRIVRKGLGSLDTWWIRIINSFSRDKVLIMILLVLRIFPIVLFLPLLDWCPFNLFERNIIWKSLRVFQWLWLTYAFINWLEKQLSLCKIHYLLLRFVCCGLRWCSWLSVPIHIFENYNEFNYYLLMDFKTCIDCYINFNSFVSDHIRQIPLIQLIRIKNHPQIILHDKPKSY